jgi:hypothetical protein
MPAALAVINILTQVLALAPMATDLFQTIQAQRNKLESIRNEGRDPTPEEWATVAAQIATLRATLHAGETAPPPPVAQP